MPPDTGIMLPELRTSRWFCGAMLRNLPLTGMVLFSFPSIHSYRSHTESLHLPFSEAIHLIGDTSGSPHDLMCLPQTLR